jgi:hypothetical protein
LKREATAGPWFESRSGSRNMQAKSPAVTGWAFCFASPAVRSISRCSRSGRWHRSSCTSGSRAPGRRSRT